MWRKSWKCLYVPKWREKVNMFRQTTWKQVDWIGYGNQIGPSTRIETSAFPSPVFFYIRMISLLFWYSIINRSSYIHIIQPLQFPLMLNFQCQGPSISTFSEHPNLHSPISINFEFLIFRSSISTTSSATSSSTGSHWTSNSANKLSKVLQYTKIYKIFMLRHLWFNF